MVSPNEKSLVNGNEISTTLIGSDAVSITIRLASGAIAHPMTASIEALIKGGMSERDALRYVMQIAAYSVGAASK